MKRKLTPSRGRLGESSTSRGEQVESPGDLRNQGSDGEGDSEAGSSDLEEVRPSKEENKGENADSVVSVVKEAGAGQGSRKDVDKGKRRMCSEPFNEPRYARRCMVCGSFTLEGFKIYCTKKCPAPSVGAENRRDSGISSIFDYFRTGATGTATTTGDVVDGRASCHVVLDGYPFQFEHGITLKLPQTKNRIRIGEDVLIEEQYDNYKRGVVVGMDFGYCNVGLIDYAKIVKVKDVYDSTEALTKVMSYGGTISFTKNEFSQSKTIKFRVKQRRLFGTWVCDVTESDRNDISEIILEEWVPQLKSYSVPFEEGCRVILSYYLDTRMVYVRRIDNSYDEDYIRFNNDIESHCIQAKRYKTNPSRGEICCARYKEDGRFYRGLVLYVDQKDVVIKFMDFGGEQLTPITDLRYLPELPKNVLQFCSAKMLKGLNLEATADGSSYLKKLISEKRPLVLGYEGRILSEMILTDVQNGDIVNNVLYDFEINAQKKSHVPSRTGKIYTITSIEKVSFSCGQTENVFVMNFEITSLKEHGIFWGTVYDRDCLDYFNVELKASMSVYCMHLHSPVYFPKKEELCIVQYEAQWYRAVCLDERDGKFQVTLLDIGVTTWKEPKSIRKMSKDFLVIPALALKCAVSGFDNMSPFEKNEVTHYLVRMKRKVIPGVRIVDLLDGVYYVMFNRDFKKKPEGYM